MFTMSRNTKVMGYVGSRLLENPTMKDQDDRNKAGLQNKTGDVAQQLRVPVFLQRTQVWFPALTSRWLTPVPRGSI